MRVKRPIAQSIVLRLYFLFLGRTDIYQMLFLPLSGENSANQILARYSYKH